MDTLYSVIWPLSLLLLPKPSCSRSQQCTVQCPCSILLLLDISSALDTVDKTHSWASFLPLLLSTSLASSTGSSFFNPHMNITAPLLSLCTLSHRVLFQLTAEAQTVLILPFKTFLNYRFFYYLTASPGRYLNFNVCQKITTLLFPQTCFPFFIPSSHKFLNLRPYKFQTIPPVTSVIQPGCGLLFQSTPPVLMIRMIRMCYDSQLQPPGWCDTVTFVLCCVVALVTSGWHARYVVVPSCSSIIFSTLHLEGRGHRGDTWAFNCLGLQIIRVFSSLISQK